MFTIINRGELDHKTEHELENFNSRLKGFLLEEHNEDGTHSDAIARTDSINEFTTEQRILSGGLRIKYDGDRSTRVFAQAFADNLIFRQLGWHLDDINFPGALFTINNTGVMSLSYATAGTNPRTLVTYMDMSTDGVLSLPFGRIKFPATQNPSSDANVLDDYEEGSWTPTLGGSGGQSGQAYDGANTAGKYIKIGKNVLALGSLVASTVGTITGSVEIKGFPFTSGSSVARGGATTNFFTGLATSVSSIVNRIPASSTVMRVAYVPAAGGTTATDFIQTDLNNGFGIVFAATYEASD